MASPSAPPAPVPTPVPGEVNTLQSLTAPDKDVSLSEHMHSNASQMQGPLWTIFGSAAVPNVKNGLMQFGGQTPVLHRLNPNQTPSGCERRHAAGSFFPMAQFFKYAVQSPAEEGGPVNAIAAQWCATEPLLAIATRERQVLFVQDDVRAHFVRCGGQTAVKPPPSDRGR